MSDIEKNVKEFILALEEVLILEIVISESYEFLGQLKALSFLINVAIYKPQVDNLKHRFYSPL